MRLMAIIMIFVATSVAWVILASSVMWRSENLDNSLRQRVERLWGTAQRQVAPRAYASELQQTKTTRVDDKGKPSTTLQEHVVQRSVPFSDSDVAVALNLDYRRKGLLWYSTYRVQFDGTYQLQPEVCGTNAVMFVFTFPADGAVYDAFALYVGTTLVENVTIAHGAIACPVALNTPAGTAVRVKYASQGMAEWWYDFGEGVKQVRDFKLTMQTDFAAVDFPENSIAPTSKTPTAAGWLLTWQYQNLLTGVRIGMRLPERLNPGPWVGRVTLAAPVALFFFLFLTLIFTTLRKIRLHPMHYLFLSASFFVFHLLLAYLVDHVSVHTAMAISSVVSLFLVISYMRIVAGARFALLEIGLAQVVYLVLFSYSFFLRGYTGLVITVMAVATLALVMQLTARLDWYAVFRGNPDRQS